MSTLVAVFTVAMVTGGVFFYLAGAVGLLRFPDTLTRLHALTKADNLGLGLIVLGLLPHAGTLAGVLKLVTIWLLVMLSSADAGQLIARIAHRTAAGAAGRMVDRIDDGGAHRQNDRPSERAVDGAADGMVHRAGDHTPRRDAP